MLCRRVAVELVLLPNARGAAAAACDLHKSKPLLTNYTSFFVKIFSSKWQTTATKQSLTVSYLISSCGLSPETALVASRKVNFRSADRPDSVLTLLRNHGFTDTHISKLARIRPDVLLSDSKRTLLPKLEFLQSIGIPTADLAKIISSNPTVLTLSLKDQLIPVYNYLKTVILLDDKQVGKTLKYSPRILGVNIEKEIVPKVAVLRKLGVPASSLSYLMTHHPSLLLRNSKKFDEAVKEVVEMGVNPLKLTFVCVLKMMVGFSKSTLEHKTEVFKKCGWSDIERDGFPCEQDGLEASCSCQSSISSWTLSGKEDYPKVFSYQSSDVERLDKKGFELLHFFNEERQALLR